MCSCRVFPIGLLANFLVFQLPKRCEAFFYCVMGYGGFIEEPETASQQARPYLPGGAAAPGLLLTRFMQVSQTAKPNELKYVSEVFSLLRRPVSAFKIFHRKRQGRRFASLIKFKSHLWHIKTGLKRRCNLKPFQPCRLIKPCRSLAFEDVSVAPFCKCLWLISTQLKGFCRCSLVYFFEISVALDKAHSPSCMTL